MNANDDTDTIKREPPVPTQDPPPRYMSHRAARRSGRWAMTRYAAAFAALARL